MRTLWMLLIQLIACGSAEAQFSKVDSSILLRYSSKGIPVKVNRLLTQQNGADNFFLAKFQRPLRETDLSNNIVRQLSDQHAIITVAGIKNQDSVYSAIEYIYPANDLWKLPFHLSAEVLSQKVSRIIVAASDSTSLLELVKKLNARIIERRSPDNFYLLEIQRSEDALTLLKSKAIVFLNPRSSDPREELLINGFDLGTNSVNLGHRKFPGINGAGLVAAIKENKFDSADIDFKGRYITTGSSSNTMASHASIMATMVAGGGNSYHLGKGAAWNAQLGSTNFAQLFPSSDAFYKQFTISVENHSYGTAIENFYGADAAAYDVSVVNNPSLVHVFSSGNSGTSASAAGSYSGISNFANLTGSFKMAKNIITVGATDSFNNVETLSSRGPAYDGRIKPDLVAFGQDGSSGAAALVSGTSLLIQHAYKLQHHDSLPSSALVRAALINTADEISSPGPDYSSGFGSLNTANAIHSIIDRNYFSGTVQHQDTSVRAITIPPGTHQFKVTMAYIDPAGQVNTFRALVNDLDLELVQLSTGQTWKPWTLNAAANKDSLALPATRNRDSLNNVEQISIDYPTPGMYGIKVTGRLVTNASQAYALVYTIDSINSFEWKYPTKIDPVFSASKSVARWNTTYSGNGMVELSVNGGGSWQLLGTADLSAKYFRWQAPDSFTVGILRMTINGNSYLSDTFVVSRQIQMNVGFNCPDSVLLVWNKIEKADQYRVYALTSNFLQPIALRSDTFFIFSKSNVNTKHFTVAPMQGIAEGRRAFTINYETQGVACYLREFLAILDNNKARLSLVLASTYNLNRIEIEKDNGASFSVFQTISNPNQLAYNIENSNLHPGVNKFRARLILNNGTVIFSNEEIVYYLANQDFIFYPNPTPVAKGFNVLRSNLDDATLILYDVYGKKVKQLLLLDLVNPVQTSSLQRGIYIAVVFDKNGKRTRTQKIVLQ